MQSINRSIDKYIVTVEYMIIHVKGKKGLPIGSLTSPPLEEKLLIKFFYINLNFSLFLKETKIFLSTYPITFTLNMIVEQKI